MHQTMSTILAFVSKQATEWVVWYPEVIQTLVTIEEQTLAYGFTWIQFGWKKIAKQVWWFWHFRWALQNTSNTSEYHTKLIMMLISNQRTRNVWNAILCVIWANKDNIPYQHFESTAKICIFENGELLRITCGIFNSLNICNCFGLLNMAIDSRI